MQSRASGFQSTMQGIPSGPRRFLGVNKNMQICRNCHRMVNYGLAVPDLPSRPLSGGASATKKLFLNDHRPQRRIRKGGSGENNTSK